MNTIIGFRKGDAIKVRNLLNKSIKYYEIVDILDNEVLLSSLESPLTFSVDKLWFTAEPKRIITKY
jgi:hypothetical protein